MNKALLTLPIWLGLLAIVFTLAFVPTNYFAVSQNADSKTLRAILIAYFGMGSLVGAIPIFRFRDWTVVRKLLAVVGYVLGAQLVLWLCLLIAVLTTVQP